MGLKNFYMKTFHGEAFEKVEDAYKNMCRNCSKGLELFLKLKNLKNDPDNYDMKIIVSEHVEDIQVYDTYTQREASFPDAVWLYTKSNTLNVETAQFVNENEELFQLTQEFYTATKNTKKGQYKAFGLDIEDRNKVDAELSDRKKILLEYISVINAEKEAEDEKPKVEAYTIDVVENKKAFLDGELNTDDKVFVIDNSTWNDYVKHINHCMEKRTNIKDDIKLIHDNKFLIRRCYEETGFTDGITINTIYEAKKDTPLKQYMDVCNTARRFAEEEFASTYKYFVSQGILKPFNPELSLIDCLYIVSHVDMLRKKQSES